MDKSEENTLVDPLPKSNLLTGHCPAYTPSWESIDSRPVPQWYSDAKFGIFVHWGPYSVPAWRPVNKDAIVYECYAEWYQPDVMGRPGVTMDWHKRNFGEHFQYRDFGPMFRAELFEPDQWAKLFEKAGARYVILTAKHHDGFALWPSSSPFTKEWNSVDTGPKRDLVGDLTKAVRLQGLKMGLYYSLIEWETTRTKRTPSGYYLPKEAVDQYGIPEEIMIDEHIIPQMKDLVLKYEPAILYADGDWDQNYEELKSMDFLSWLYNNAPNKAEIVVNDRWGQVRGKHGGYYSREYADTDDILDKHHPWEEIQGMGLSFGYNRGENIDDYRSSKELIHLLISTVGRGGNLCLNIGPAADGTIPVIMQQRLLDIGHWLEINGEGVYGSKAWLMPKEVKLVHEKADTELFFTQKDRDIFVFCTKWPEEPLILKQANFKENSTVTMLGSNKAIKAVSENGKLVIFPPQLQPSEIPDANAFVFKIHFAKPFYEYL